MWRSNVTDQNVPIIREADVAFFTGDLGVVVTRSKIKGAHSGQAGASVTRVRAKSASAAHKHLEGIQGGYALGFQRSWNASCRRRPRGCERFDGRNRSPVKNLG